MNIVPTRDAGRGFGVSEGTGVRVAVGLGSGVGVKVIVAVGKGVDVGASVGMAVACTPQAVNKSRKDNAINWDLNICLTGRKLDLFQFHQLLDKNSNTTRLNSSGFSTGTAWRESSMTVNSAFPILGRYASLDDTGV